MSDLAHVTAHEDEGVALMSMRVRQVIEATALLRSWLAQIQDLEDAALAVRQSRIIDSATGAHLDLIGRVVGQAREGRDDPAYRIALKARLAINVSSGTPDQIIVLVRLITGLLPSRYLELYPAGFVVEIAGAVTTTTATETAKAVKQARAGGVNGQVVYSPAVDANTFTFSSGDTEEASTTQGWADNAQLTGGVFADVIGA